MLILPFCLPRTQVGLLPPCAPARLFWTVWALICGEGRGRVCGSVGKEGGSGGDTATQLLLRSKMKMKRSLLQTDNLEQTGEDKRGFGAFCFWRVLEKPPGVSSGQRRGPPRPPAPQTSCMQTPVLPATGLSVRWCLAAPWDSSNPVVPFLGSLPAAAPEPQ